MRYIIFTNPFQTWHAFGYTGHGFVHYGFNAESPSFITFIY